MRLQVTVLRNGLAPIRNVFNTTSRQFAFEKIVLISDLLHAINQTIQLEDDNNWGFEDYIVETRLNDHQAEAYECFHYQAVEDVLKEDDEVTIRPLNSTEIKQRERGGRYQINNGGMHLIDGSPWGRAFALNRSRPRISIPPRRRSAALDGLAPAAQIAGVEEDAEEPNASQQLQIEDTPRFSAVIPFENADEDDSDEEDDEDYVSEDDSSEDNDVGIGEVEEYKIQEVLDESRGLLADLADEIEEAGHEALPSTLLVMTESNIDQQGTKKRKRSDRLQDKRQTRQRIDASPDSGTAIAVNSQPAVNGKQISATSSTRTVHFDNASSDSSSEEDSDFDASSWDSEESENLDEAELPSRTNGHEQSEEAVEDEISSSSSTDSESEKDEERVDDTSKQKANALAVARTAPSSNSDSDTSSSDSDSDSDSSSDTDSESDSSDGEDASESTTNSAVENIAASDNNKSSAAARTMTGTSALGVTSANKGSELQNLDDLTNSTHLQAKQPNVPPGQGMSKTRRNNDRKKRSKLMARLKAEGKLPPNADFEMLRAYLQEHEGMEWADSDPQVENAPDHNTDSNNGDGANEDALNARRQEIFDKLNVQDPAHRADAQPQVEPKFPDLIVASDYPVTTVAQSLEMSPILESALVPITEAQTSIDDNMVRDNQQGEPSPQRARLDVASSRRMLFNALGVRTPKTPAAEQALREKLSKPSREVRTRESEEKASIAPPIQSVSQGRWKSKLIIKAVECVNKKKTIEVPPFPFKHPWQVRREKEQGIYQEQEESFYADDMEGVLAAEGEAQEEQPQAASQAFTTSRTLTAGSREAAAEDLPIPSDFDVLFDLQPTDLVVGTVIAYKELHLDNNYQPVPSPYRVAKIMSKDNKNLRLQLASRYRDLSDSAYDEETGERIYNKFDMPMDDEQDVDDGQRELTFNDLIAPKFVKPSDTADTVVAASQISEVQSSYNDKVVVQNASLRGGDARIDPVDQDISTPRRAEIDGLIKEAGFESGLDEQILQPLSKQGQHAADSYSESERQNTELTQVTQTEETQGTPQALLITQDSDWISTSENLFSTPIGPITETGPEPQSSLSESIVESVRYPNLSQLEFTPLPTSTQLQSSPHQDAQRLTPTPAETSGLAVTLLTDAENNQHTSQAHSSNSMPSVIPETQANTNDSVQQDVPEIAVGNAPQPSSPSQIPSFDGSSSPRPQKLLQPESSLRDQYDSSDEIDKLPSVRSLTSSQVRKINGHRRADASTADDEKSKSLTRSRTTRRSPRISKIGSLDLHDEDEISETESPDSSLKPIKPSASQKERTRPSLSQIPEDTIVVDLTQSSPAESPQNKTATREVRKNTRLSAGSSSTFKRAFEGLGERSMLKKKRKSA